MVSFPPELTDHLSLDPALYVDSNSSQIEPNEISLRENPLLVKGKLMMNKMSSVELAKVKIAERDFVTLNTGDLKKTYRIGKEIGADGSYSTVRFCVHRMTG